MFKVILILSLLVVIQVKLSNSSYCDSTCAAGNKNWDISYLNFSTKFIFGFKGINGGGGCFDSSIQTCINGAICAVTEVYCGPGNFFSINDLKKN